MAFILQIKSISVYFIITIPSTTFIEYNFIIHKLQWLPERSRNYCWFNFSQTKVGLIIIKYLKISTICCLQLGRICSHQLLTLVYFEGRTPKSELISHILPNNVPDDLSNTEQCRNFPNWEETCTCTLSIDILLINIFSLMLQGRPIFLARTSIP